MNFDPWLWIPAAAILVAISVQAFFSRLETAVMMARRSRFAQLAPEDDPRRAQAETLLDDPEAFQTAAHITTNLCEAITYPAAASVSLALTAMQGEDLRAAQLLRQAAPSVFVALLCAVLGILVFGEALPKTLARRHPEAILLRNARFMKVYSTILTPALLLVGWMSQTASRVFHIHHRSGARVARTEEEILSIVGGSAEEGVIQPEEKEMIHSIFDFTETSARQIMVPRVEIHAVEENATVEEAAGNVLEYGHSRIPIYRNTLDQVVGVVYAKDLLRELLAGHDREPALNLAREPFFVPEGKKLDELLAEFRHHRTQMAIVVDEFGGTSGLVTLEDVLEEIVGEIQDEYDAEEPAVQVIDAQTAVVDAHLSIDDVNDALGLELPPGDYDTLGGFVYDLFGRPPEVGEQVTAHNIRFVVEETEGPRLLKLRTTRLSPNAPPPNGAGPAEP